MDHHYLKGSLFCGRCQRDDIKRRMIIQRTINSKGAEYLYLFCRGRQKGACPTPHVNVTLVENTFFIAVAACPPLVLLLSVDTSTVRGGRSVGDETAVDRESEELVHRR